jgi:hypothetical protein
LVNHLADGGFELFVAGAFAGGLEFGEACFDGLEESNFVLDIEGLVVGDGDRKGLG